jgi:DNA-binding transcriptional MerR regulator
MNPSQAGFVAAAISGLKTSNARKAMRPENRKKKRRPAIRKQGTPALGLKMKELAAAAGAAKSTILYYLGQGLLPEPRKTSPNMAYYDPACVERVQFIQKMQQHHRLTLAEIKKCLDDRDRGSELGVYLELNEEIFGPYRPRRLLDAKAFCRETGLSADQLDELQRARLLLPLEAGRFDAEDVSMGRMLLGALNFGIRAGDLSYYAEFGEKIVDREMALRNRMTGRLPYQEDASATMAMVKNARMCRAYIIDRLFQHRVAAMKDLKAEPVPEREEREPWLD